MDCITVEEFIYLNRPNRYRFTLAHEVAHRILHAELYGDQSFDDIASWREFITSLSTRQYRFLEWHANSFAGLVLVPRDRLESETNSCISMVDDDLLSTNTDFAWDFFSREIARSFEVSPEVIQRRWHYDGIRRRD